MCRKIKKLFVALLCLSLLFSQVGTCSAEYTMTEVEMQKLQQNSIRLSEINSYLQMNSSESQQTLLQVSKELQASKDELILLKAELAKLQETLQTAKNLSQSQQDLLNQTNESFKTYAKETKAKINKLNNQKTMLEILLGIAVGAAIYECVHK